MPGSRSVSGQVGQYGIWIGHEPLAEQPDEIGVHSQPPAVILSCFDDHPTRMDNQLPMTGGSTPPGYSATGSRNPPAAWWSGNGAGRATEGAAHRTRFDGAALKLIQFLDQHALTAK